MNKQTVKHHNNEYINNNLKNWLFLIETLILCKIKGQTDKHTRQNNQNTDGHKDEWPTNKLLDITIIIILKTIYKSRLFLIDSLILCKTDRNTNVQTDWQNNQNTDGQKD